MRRFLLIPLLILPLLAACGGESPEAETGSVPAADPEATEPAAVAVVPPEGRPDPLAVVTTDFCRSLVSEAEARELTGLDDPFFLRVRRSEMTGTASCLWSVAMKDGGPQCQGVTASERSEGRCVTDILDVNVNCNPEQTHGTGAKEHVETLALLNKEPVELGDAAVWSQSEVSSKLDIASEGCLLLIRRLPALADEGAEAADLRDRLVGVGRITVDELARAGRGTE